MKPRLAVDMDEVLADSLTQQLRRYRDDFGDDVTAAQLHGLHLADFVPAARRQRVLAYPTEPGFFADLAPIEGAREAIAALAPHFEIFVVTAAMEFPNSFAEKYHRLARHFPLIRWPNIVFCGNKGIIKADILLDDHSRNLRDFSARGLLFSAPHNLRETDFERVDNWSHALTVLIGEN